MSITNYWFQLIWILTAGIILTRFLPKKQEIVMGRIEERWQMAPAVLLVIPYIIAAALRSDNLETPMHTGEFSAKHRIG